jgi:hypothetical protein
LSAILDRLRGIDSGRTVAEIQSSARPSVLPRIIVATLVAIAATAIAWLKAHAPDSGFVIDFGYYWTGGKEVLAGHDPYKTVVPFIYPLTAAVALTPLAWLPLIPAGVVFMGVSMGCCAYALTREGWERLPILMSFPALWAMSSGQWAPLVACAALSSGFGWAAACKPTLGIVMLARRMRWQGFAVAAAFGVLTLLIVPLWPLAWITAMRQFSGEKLHHIPILIPGGLLLLLAALRWRTPDGRLLLGMAVIPQSMFAYDQFALGLLARTRLQAIIWSLWSYAVMLAGFLLAPSTLGDTKAANAAYFARVVVWGYYLPALIVVLRRSGVSEAVTPLKPRAVDSTNERV